MNDVFIASPRELEEDAWGVDVDPLLIAIPNPEPNPWLDILRFPAPPAGFTPVSEHPPISPKRLAFEHHHSPKPLHEIEAIRAAGRRIAKQNASLTWAGETLTKLEVEGRRRHLANAIAKGWVVWLNDIPQLTQDGLNTINSANAMTAAQDERLKLLERDAAALPDHVFFDGEDRPSFPLEIFQDLTTTRLEKESYLAEWEARMPLCIKAANSQQAQAAAVALVNAWNDGMANLPRDPLEVFARSNIAHRTALDRLPDREDAMWELVEKSGGISRRRSSEGTRPAAYKGAHPKDWKSPKQLALLTFLSKHDSQAWQAKEIAEKCPEAGSKNTIRDCLQVLKTEGWAIQDGKEGSRLTPKGKGEAEKNRRKYAKSRG